MERPNPYFDKAPTKAVLAETVKLLQFCWDEGFGRRMGCSVLEILMVECEARGIKFVVKDEGLIIQLAKPATITAEDVLKEQKVEGRWDGG
jgi:hypothetical protein